MTSRTVRPCRSKLRRRQQPYRTESRCQQDQPLTLLWNTIVYAVHDFVRDAITGFFQLSHEFPEYIVSYEPRDVFHGDQFGGKLSDESGELQKKSPSLVRGIGLLVVCRKSLAGCASSQEANTVFAEYLFEIARFYFLHRFEKELRTVVGNVRKLARWIDIYPESNVDARTFQAVRQPSGTAEQVHSVDLPLPWSTRSFTFHTLYHFRSLPPSAFE